ncbi:hypothetical protein GWI33_005863 [Rhynchophorus ferrugineus]|uniref:Uncharacterized protein n=1 Tax=Rhynchophorus ferrugineus TaxID=354439 RepID=A0A834ME46_RHYFE|nr:hypothetical protein GWI33_005863 [Rhynchophorus ferrugineus]
MIFKIVFLTCLGVSTVSSENTKLDDLNSLINTLDRQIQDLTSKSAFVLRPLQVALGYYAGEAHKAFISNLTVAAQPYWSAVAQAKKTVEEQGQNIDSCVKTSNSEIYATNDTFADKTNQNIKTELTAGQKILSDIYDVARNEPVKKLDGMHQKVKSCNKEVCAIELIEQLNKEYNELSSRVKTSLDKANDYAPKEFIKKMDQYVIVPLEYHNEIRRITAAFEMCIKKK